MYKQALKKIARTNTVQPSPSLGKYTAEHVERKKSNNLNISLVDCNQLHGVLYADKRCGEVPNFYFKINEDPFYCHDFTQCVDRG